jgi:hypothetical protein
MKTTAGINRFLLDHGIRIRTNPAVSPDLCLDAASLARAVREALPQLRELAGASGSERAAMGLVAPAGGVDFFPASELPLNGRLLFVVEERATGDAGVLVVGGKPLPLEGAVALADGWQLVPLLWANLVPLKNLLQEADPESTVFPVARGPLAHSSIGVGARFTTLHWPAVAWAMKELRLPLTANQNSIPRELVYDVDAMLEDRLAQVPFPFIGGHVPEGHQGQSVQGMSHASVVTYLKCGFHRRRIPWGFNADHQPVGGRYDAIEDELVRGCAFASYITFDLSPELAEHRLIEDPAELDRAFAALGEQALFERVLGRLTALGLAPDEAQARRIFCFVMPAMRKLKRRDAAYAQIRSELFTTDIGRLYFRELSIDELPGLTTPETLALCLAIAEALQVRIHFVAPNIGFQKNFPYPDDAELERRVASLYAVARGFGVSIGFHSGSGKSAANYAVAGRITSQNLEIKTSGRYTYEMGAALAASTDPGDQALWRDWYGFTRELAIEGAFSDNAVRQKLAREFVLHALAHEKRPSDGVFESAGRLRQALLALPASPDHMFWFEYNFLYVLAGDGKAARLGDHGPAGYAQRARFYAVSPQAQLAFARNVAGYILFVAETTGLAAADAVAAARRRLEGLRDLDAFWRDLVA